VIRSFGKRTTPANQASRSASPLDYTTRLEVAIRPVRRISVIAPMWNEAGHIPQLVADLANQTFDGDVELIVADGRSTDDSVNQLRRAADRHDLEVKILDNPARWVSPALNRCIREATGDLIVRVDCHSGYPSDYLSRCAAAAEETGADNVGGIFIPCGRTLIERAVAAAMDSPFGGIHWTRQAHKGRVEVDTVPYGAFRPEAFERAGVFDETLIRDEDEDFNFRLRSAGGRIVLDPSIRIFYTPRSSWRRVFHQYYEYGLWKPAVMWKHRRVVSVRSLAPGAFVVSLLGLAAVARWRSVAVKLLAVDAGTYAAGAAIFGVAAVKSHRVPWRLLPSVIAAFPVFHVAYGLGTIAGWLRVLHPPRERLQAHPRSADDV
jgi:succinoglycan biosynthesis protein ExoA